MPDSAAAWSPSRGPTSAYRRRLPVGAEPIERGLTHVRVWAPRARRVQVVTHAIAPATVIGGSGLQAVSHMALEPEAGGYHSGSIKAGLGDRYQFKLDDDERLYPDPASRFQPEGPHGPSEIVDPRAFDWTDDAWAGVSIEGQVVYEMHVGTFTKAGTYAAATDELRELARLGITMIEVMPVAEFHGRFGWGYDGEALYAPSHLYGTPDDFRRFV